MKYEKVSLNKPHWRDILDVEKHPGWVSTVQEFANIAQKVGYSLICFNGLIWEIEGGVPYQTGWEAKDLD